VSAVVNRDGARQTLNVTPERGAGATALNDLITRRGERNLQRLPNFNLNPDRFPPDIRSFILPRQLGATLTPLSEQLEAYFGVGNGVLVSSVEANSVASAAGLRAGDVITRVNGQQVNAPNDVSQAVRSAGAEINVTVVREKKELTLKARFPERELPSGSRGVAL
jgi:predicted metalloprotease with PDZ domain